MMANSRMKGTMDTVSLHLRQGKSMKGTGDMTKGKVREPTTGLMGKSMLETGQTERKMEREFIHGPVDKCMMDSGKITSTMVKAI